MFPEEGYFYISEDELMRRSFEPQFQGKPLAWVFYQVVSELDVLNPLEISRVQNFYNKVMVHLKYCFPTTLPLLWGRVQSKLFSLFLIILSLSLCIIPSAMGQNLHIDSQKRAYTPISEIRQNGTQTVRLHSGKLDTIHHLDKDMTTVRDTMRGIKSNPTRLPATITQTVSKGNVARGLLNNLRRLRGGLPGIAFQLISPLLIQEGYEWLEEQQTYVKRGRANSACVSRMAVYQNQYAYSEITFSQCNTYQDHVVTKPDNASLNKTCDDFGRSNGYSSGYSSYSNSHGGVCLAGNTVVALVRFTFDIVPITDNDMERIMDQVPSERVAELLPAAVDPATGIIPGTTAKVHVLPGTIVNSQPFTDKDGKPKQIRWEFYDCEDGQSCVRETLTDRPDLQPNSPAAPAPDNPPANGNDTAPGNGDSAGNNTGSGNQSGNQGDQDKDDLCRKYPHIMACDEQPEPGSYDLSIPHETVNLSFHPDNVFSTDAACPAGATFDVFGQTATISLAPACDAARSVRPMLIALAWLAAAFFVIRTVRAAV